MLPVPTRRAPLLCLSLLLACEPEDPASPAGVPEDTGEATAFDAAATLREDLVGTYDSAEQAAEDPAYYDILLTMCPLDLPELGEHVLYVEQSLHETPGQPYRQRLYLLEAGETEGEGVSRIFEHARPRSLVGGCLDPEALEVAVEDLTELEGCEVILSWDATEARWTGGTIADHCATDWNGATWATSEISLDAEVLVSWDRGWSAEGEYVWGATEGGYRFVRRSELGAW